MSILNSIKKKLALPLIILVIGGGVITLIMASKSAPVPNSERMATPEKTKAAVQFAVREPVTLTTKSQGTVNPKREIDLVAQVSGLVISVEEQFVDGEFFKKNTLLIEIDPRDHQAALLDAKARLAQAQRNLAEEKGRSRQAKREWRDLGNAEANALFLRKPQLAQVQSALEYAQADVEIAQLNIERTQISVPFDGRIQQTYVDVGQFVTRGTVLAKVYDIAHAEIRLPLSDRQLALLDLPLVGSKLSSAPVVTLTAKIAGKAEQWQGVINRTEASIDNRSRMYYAVAELKQPFLISGDMYHSAPLTPGLFVAAEIEGKQLDNVIVLPSEAIVNRTNIYTLNAKNEIEIQPVNILSKNAERVWIQANVPENTPILLEKHAVVSVGTVIEPIFAVSESSNAGVVMATGK